MSELGASVGIGPPVSVIVPAFNAEAFIDECLASIYAQKLPVEIIVVDDGSTDGTTARVRSYPDVILLSQGNRGPAAARNAALAVASYPLVAFLDADDVWPAGSLAVRRHCLAQQPHAVLAIGDCQQFSDSRRWDRTLFQAGDYLSQWGSGPLIPEPYLALLQGNFITTGSVLARRDQIAAIGGFDESLRWVEDLDLWLRLARRYPIAWVPDVCLLRRRHATNVSRDQRHMTEAYLKVLDRQGTDDSLGLAPAAGAVLHRRYAEEAAEMFGYAIGDRRLDTALRWLIRSWRSHPTPGTLRTLARAALRSRVTTKH